MFPLLKHFSIFILWLLIILYLSFSPLKDWPKSNFFDKIYLDKVIHLTMYSLLAFFLLIGILKQQNSQALRFTIMLWACSFCALYGIIIEILQPQLTMYRRFEWMDMAANVAGAFAGIVVFNWVRRFILRRGIQPKD